jgi:hypothetical protein
MVHHHSPTLTAEQFEELASRLDTAELWDGHMVLREPAVIADAPGAALFRGLV